jgi:2-dehydro-3-deoxygluconokinase
VEIDIQLMKKLNGSFPRLKKVFDKTRETVSASHNRIQGKLWNGEEFVKTKFLDVTHIVDRVGTGDAYAAGLIYGLLHCKHDMDALEFATAACALKHTIEGDANMVSLENVQRLVGGDTSGSIVR